MGLYRQVHVKSHKLRMLLTSRDHALGNADLNRGQADARSLVHRLEHVIDELADAAIDLFDRLGEQPQSLVGKFNNLAHRHGGDVTGA